MGGRRLAYRSVGYWWGALILALIIGGPGLVGAGVAERRDAKNAKGASHAPIQP